MLRKEQIVYVYKEYKVQSELGWYYICFMKKDSSIHIFTCWYNSTSIGKTPFDLTTREFSRGSSSLDTLGNYKAISRYDKTKLKLLTLEQVRNIESNFRRTVEEKTKLEILCDNGYDINTSIQFNPVLLFFFEIKRGDEMIGCVYFINGRFMPIGLYSVELLTCIKILEEAFLYESGFYRLRLK